MRSGRRIRRNKEMAKKQNNDKGKKMTTMMMMIMIIQFNSLLFMHRVNSYKANYRHSTVCILVIILRTNSIKTTT
jgi:hypothetical protein